MLTSGFHPRSAKPEPLGTGSGNLWLQQMAPVILIRGQVWETGLELYQITVLRAWVLSVQALIWCDFLFRTHLQFSQPHSGDHNICELAVGCPQLLVQ